MPTLWSGISYLQYTFLYTQIAKKINPVYVRNTESSLGQQNSFFAFLQKVNNSIATKLCVNLINTCAIFLGGNGARHNSMTKLCYVFFKYENKLKVD